MLEFSKFEAQSHESYRRDDEMNGRKGQKIDQAGTENEVIPSE